MIPFNLSFAVPEPLSQYLEILPQYGLIQGESKFAAQLKFLPTKELLMSTEYVDSDSGLLEAPIHVTIVGQVSQLFQCE